METQINDRSKEQVIGQSDLQGMDSSNNENPQFSKLDPRILTSWRISRWIRFGVVAIFQGAGFFIGSLMEDVPSEVTIIYLTFNLLLAAYFIIAAILYPLIEYRQWGYKITEDRVEIRHGIFFIQTTIIPVIRIQHVTITQGPINRKLGISTIFINTASGAFKIEGLSDENAKQIAEALKSKLVIRMKKNEISQ
jgi:membrane protein YdbS with pleckstrin-like domain